MGLEIRNEFFETYLGYLEETESPKLFHAWSAVAAISAALGRRNWLEFNNDELYPNHYIFIMGPPATRKSTGMKQAKRILQEATGVRFAPDDTAGRYQGLITAIEGAPDGDAPDELAKMDAATLAANLDKLGQIQIQGDPRDQHVIAAFASELMTFLGTNSMDMLRALLKIWDGEDYEYQLKATSATLSDPLMTIIGCATPTQIAHGLPPEAIGQGFMSRVILVYASEKEKFVPRQPPFDMAVRARIVDHLGFLYYKFEGKFTESKNAAALVDKLYAIEFPINDPRFVFYVERRQTHLLKLSMVMAAGRKSHEISEQDVVNAHTLLRHTEMRMSDALGEFGMSPLALCKQRLMEFISHSKDPIPEDILWAVMHRDMRIVDFHSTLQELTNSGKIAKILMNTSAGQVTGYIRKGISKNVTIEDITELLAMEE